MYKALLAAIVVLVLFSACKQKKSCWKCSVLATDKNPGLDTLVCDMTSDESKEFQQALAKRMKAEYGELADLSSYCHKQDR